MNKLDIAKNDKFKIQGGGKLEGKIRLTGAKNAALPIVAAALLTQRKVILHDFPQIIDAKNMLLILESLGCKYTLCGNDVELDPSGANNWNMPEELSKELRSSIFMLGPVIARFKKAKFTYPGGCEIGNRPIDLHLKGLRELNVEIIEEHGYIICNGENMRGADVHLDYPSVGATENLMLAAVGAKGKTTITNAAREPEIIELEKFLCAMGASVVGAGTSTIVVEGNKKLGAVEHTLMSDRIVAGTFFVGAAITKGDLFIENANAQHLFSVIAKLKESGCEFFEEKSGIRVVGKKRPTEMRIIQTQPYPGFPTDMQAQIFALCAVAKGTSVIFENVFENRFKHACELRTMGAEITIKDTAAIIRGVRTLTGANVFARDLRAGAALVLAGICAKGETTVNDIKFIDRGYEDFDGALRSVGAKITRI